MTRWIIIVWLVLTYFMVKAKLTAIQDALETQNNMLFLADENVEEY